MTKPLYLFSSITSYGKLGFLGLEYFFVLSSFLITWIALEEYTPEEIAQRSIDRSGSEVPFTFPSINYQDNNINIMDGHNNGKHNNNGRAYTTWAKQNKAKQSKPK